MITRPVLKYNDQPEKLKILKAKAFPVLKFDKELQKLIEEMKRVIKIGNKKESDISYIGLAAPQIGETKRVFILYLNNKFKVYINPKIKTGGPTEKMLEGCLSFPDIFVPVERPSLCKINYYNEQGIAKKLKTSGFTAKAIQHEYDHLEGKLLSDQTAYKKLKKEALTKNKSLEEVVYEKYYA